MKSAYRSSDFIYYLIGFFAAALSLAKIIGFIDTFGDVYGVVVPVTFMVTAFLILQYFSRLAKLPQIAFGACIYVLLYSSNFTMLDAILAAILVELLGYGIVRAAFLLATKVVDRYTVK